MFLTLRTSQSQVSVKVGAGGRWIANGTEGGHGMRIV